LWAVSARRTEQPPDEPQSSNGGENVANRAQEQNQRDP
jgi:hypothetical protein